MRIRDEFCSKLDTQELVRADCIIVLRNTDQSVTSWRMEYGVELAEAGYGSFVIMPYADSTHGEAVQIRQMLGKKITSAIIVTNQDHHYRAFLTFLNVMPNLRIASAPLAGPRSDLEFQKIKEYQQRGDVASYEEGLKRLT